LAAVGDWGFAVYEEDGSFIASRWPKAATFEIGSGPSSMIRLPKLEKRHAIFFADEATFSVIPIGAVRVNGARISNELHVFQPNDELLVGSYRFQFFREPKDDGEVPIPAQPVVADAPPNAANTAPPYDAEAIAKKAADARGPEFKIDAYRFCHDPEYGKKGTEGTDFCAIFDASSEEVCPEAKKHCAEWKALPPLCFVDEEGGEPEESENGPDNKGFICKNGGRGSGDGSTPTNKARIARRIPSPFQFDLHIPPAAGWIIIAIAIALALFWFIKSLKDAGWEKDDAPPDLGSGLSEAERNLQALPEARSTALLKLAERSLERGDAREAAILVHLAILRYLDDEGLARYHPSRTNGDYLRAIRRHKPIAQLFRRIANQTERIRFGDGAVDELRLREELDEARRVLVRGTVKEEGSSSAAMGAATIVLLSFVAMSQTSCDEPLDPAYHSRGPIGMAAMPAVLKAAGLPVELVRQKLDAIPPDIGVVVIRDSATDIKHWPDGLKLDTLLDRGLAVVVIDDLWKSKFFLPVTATIAHSNEAVALDVDVGSSCTRGLQPVRDIPEETAKIPIGRRLIIPPFTRTGTAPATSKRLEVRPFLAYGDQHGVNGQAAAYAVSARRIGDGPDASELDGCIYLFADRDLFTNASLTRSSNTKLVVAFFASILAPGKKIMLLDRLDQWTVSKSEGGDEKKPEPESPSKAMKASNMLPFILQGAVALIALYILLGAAFGPLRDPVTVEHKAFVEHVEAIGRQYMRTGVMGLTHAARQLARLVVVRQRDRVRGGNTGWAAVSQHLAQKLDLEEKDVRAALRLGIDGTSELGTPAPDDPSPSSERMLRTLSRLLGGREQPASRRRR
jgi:hypothetical protein